jgi:hypothetical protein
MTFLQDLATLAIYLHAKNQPFSTYQFLQIVDGAKFALNVSAKYWLYLIARNFDTI